jgi:hypothetical protein
MSNLERRRLSFYRRDSFDPSPLAMTDSLSVIAGMGIGFGNGGGTKERKGGIVCVQNKFYNLER